jgi:hypothetical protein
VLGMLVYPYELMEWTLSPIRRLVSAGPA